MKSLKSKSGNVVVQDDRRRDGQVDGCMDDDNTRRHWWRPRVQSNVIKRCMKPNESTYINLYCTDHPNFDNCYNTSSEDTKKMAFQQSSITQISYYTKYVVDMNHEMDGFEIAKIWSMPRFVSPTTFGTSSNHDKRMICHYVQQYGENAPGIPCTCATSNFTYLARVPLKASLGSAWHVWLKTGILDCMN